MAAYFNLNDNEILKKLLVNKINMILDNQGLKFHRKTPVLESPSGLQLY